ncbi:uncharacterized protein C1orf131 homolog isoform X2 [Brienomyrus brachyistius]|uniref:uncharacterized protein C1orf131 homolog isoform X2 n=1 Tax=Brienomyrus brachyistius TaxID=42636 RepID=UPI0020B234B9|nr:uncharacterized protein C1orf131 homolog isoform X2 [Brienomyrus brachyistius]
MNSQNKELIENDMDNSFLDQVLNKLYDFGDGPREGRKKKLKKKQSEVEASVDDIDAAHSDCTDENDCGPRSPAEPVVPDAPDTCKAGGAALSAQIDVVTFQDPLKKNSKTNATMPEKEPQQVKKGDKGDLDRFNLEKARLEVHRFGITGFQKEQRRQFEQERAIMLGAKPPKKEHINYKVYQQMIKEKKLKEKEEVTSDTKKKKKQKDKEKEKKRKSTSSALPTGQVGRFKNGMLVLSSKEIQKIKNSRMAK